MSEINDEPQVVNEYPDEEAEAEPTNSYVETSTFDEEDFKSKCAAAAAIAQQFALKEQEQGLAEENGKRKLDSSDSEDPKPKRAAYEGETNVPTNINSSGFTSSASANGDITEYFHCPSSKVGKLIGKGGSTIKELEGKSHTRLQVEQDAPGAEKPVRITGSKADVQNVLKLIHELLEAETVVGAGDETRQIECAKGLVGRVIGRGGEAIRLMQRSSGARITVNQDFPDEQPRVVNISGETDAVERAVKMVNELIGGGEHASAQAVVQKYGLGVTQTVNCPKDKVGRIIGRGGSTIKDLQRRLQASIEVKQNADPCQIIISGTEMAVNNTKQAVLELIEENRMGGGGHFGGHQGFPGGFPPVGGFAPQNAYGAPGYGGYPAGFSAYSGYPGYPGSYPVPNASGYPGYGAAGYGADPYGSAAGASYGSAYHGAGSSTGAAAASSAASAVPSASSTWQSLQDEQGRTYYYNTQTGACQWEKPTD